jgi:hypothetical protein
MLHEQQSVSRSKWLSRDVVVLVTDGRSSNINSNSSNTSGNAHASMVAADAWAAAYHGVRPPVSLSHSDVLSRGRGGLLLAGVGVQVGVGGCREIAIAYNGMCICIYICLCSCEYLYVYIYIYICVCVCVWFVECCHIHKTHTYYSLSYSIISLSLSLSLSLFFCLYTHTVSRVFVLQHTMDNCLILIW